MKKIVLIITCVISLMCSNIRAQDFTYAAQKSVHSVVHIKCAHHQQTSYYDDFYSNDFFSQFFGYDPFGFDNRQSRPKQKTQTYQTAGSGVIISADGYIVTNNHVVADADSIAVTLNDRREFSAKLIGTDAINDLAVIKISAPNLQPLSYGNSDEVQVGQWVLAVGNPFNLTSTVTAGIVSAKARNINILSSNTESNTLSSFIQTDAAMNPGNSGGALVNTKGELIGINAAIASNTGSYTGYSFAIPVNIAKKVVNDIIKYGSTQQASAGMIVQEINSSLAKDKNLKDNHGMYVSSIVKGGAADKAGIKDGDVIKSVNGKEINTLAELNEIIAQFSPNQQITMQIEHNGTISDKSLTLLDRGEISKLGEAQLGDEVSAMGASFREINSKEKEEYGLSRGLVVTKVGKSAFKNIGIKNGFIVTAIDGNVNLSIKDAKNLATKKGKTTIEGFYPNSNRSYYFVLVL